jgi:hypothetical protein
MLSTTKNPMGGVVSNVLKKESGARRWGGYLPGAAAIGFIIS